MPTIKGFMIKCRVCGDVWEGRMTCPPKKKDCKRVAGSAAKRKDPQYDYCEIQCKVCGEWNKCHKDRPRNVCPKEKGTDCYRNTKHRKYERNSPVYCIVEGCDNVVGNLDGADRDKPKRCPECKAKKKRKEKEFICDICGDTFTKSTSHAKYCDKPECTRLGTGRAQKRKEKQCVQCGRIFPSTSLTNMVCKECFLTEGILGSPNQQRREQIEKEKRERPVECQICGEVFGGVITHTHLSLHGVTTDIYKQRYGEDSLYHPDKLREQKEQFHTNSHTYTRTQELMEIWEQEKAEDSVHTKCYWCNHPLTYDQWKHGYYCRQNPDKMGKGRTHKHSFCSKACTASHYLATGEGYTKEKGSRRSKGEIFGCKLIEQLYPDLSIETNYKALIPPYEVDIYIPELNLAVEYDGEPHFSPVYGEEKFKRRQFLDKLKDEMLEEEGICLVRVDGRIKNKHQRFMEMLAKIDELMEKKNA